MAKEYIERGAALDTLLFEMSGTGYQSRAMDAVRFVPAADVVEVVRCKDCKFWRAMDDGFSFHNRGRTDGECEMLFERHYSERCLTGGEHFCRYGERKSEI